MQSQSSSTASLLTSSSSRFSSKRWEASFGKLASSYGFGVAIPALPPKSKREKTVTSARIFSQPEPVPVLVPKSEKDFEAAFGALSSSYGFAGGVPSKPPKTTKTAKSSFSISSIETSRQQPGSRPPKDYQSAFGDLSSSYGFGGASWAPRK